MSLGLPIATQVLLLSRLGINLLFYANICMSLEAENHWLMNEFELSNLFGIVHETLANVVLRSNSQDFV